MIQLTYRPAPIELTTEKIANLTQLFQKEGKSVWKQPYIERELMLLSNNKCCYCECRLGIEDKYMEVEHFLPKDTYPNEVVEWTNLLPSCSRCNKAKGRHDTNLYPIIHPIRDSPSVHLKLNCFFFRAKTEIGKTTINTLKLNDRVRLVTVRQNLCSKLIEQLDHLHELVEEYVDGSFTSSQRKNRIINTFRQILIECTPLTEYAATASTIILQQENYTIIKNLFQEQSFWDEEFEKLEQQALRCRLL